MFNCCGRASVCDVPPQRTDLGRMGRITRGTRTSRKTPTCFPASRTGPNLNLCTDLMSTPTISNSTSPSASRTGLISAAPWTTCSRSSATTTSRTLRPALLTNKLGEATPWCPPANPLQPSTWPLWPRPLFYWRKLVLRFWEMLWGWTNRNVPLLLLLLLLLRLHRDPSGRRRTTRAGTLLLENWKRTDKEKGGTVMRRKRRSLFRDGQES